MPKEDAHVNLFITKTGQWRARITPKVISDKWGKQPGASYEVSIGSESWNRGKGREHDEKVRVLMESQMVKLATMYALTVGWQKQSETRVIIDLVRGVVKCGDV